MIKAITLQQPWATLVACGRWKYEPRDYAVNYRGPIAIHAATKLDGIDAAMGLVETQSALCEMGYALEFLPLGAIIAVGELAECVPLRALPSDVQREDARLSGRAVGHALRFEHMRELDRPIAASGRGMLWTVPAEVEPRLRAALDAAVSEARFLQPGDLVDTAGSARGGEHA
jgi:hypothetical protein